MRKISLPESIAVAGGNTPDTPIIACIYIPPSMFREFSATATDLAPNIPEPACDLTALTSPKTPNGDLL